MLTPLERKIVEAIMGSQLISKEDLKRSLQGNGSIDALDSVLQRLVDKDILTAIRPMGSTCYIITQKGTKLISE